VSTATLEVPRRLAPSPDRTIDLTAPDELVLPAFWHCPDYALTIGPEVADLNRLFGYGPNPEQCLLLDGNFGMDLRGRLTAFEVFVLAARQNLKTGFFIQRALGKALLMKRRLQIWTAHKESATDQAFAEFVAMMERSAELSKRVRRMPEGKGSKAIEFVNGCAIVFRPRTGKAGQSMSADDVDLDEYFAVEPKHEGSLLPTMSTRVNAQVGGASSAPHKGSDTQRTLMARGRAAAEGRAEEPRLLYAEWSPIRRTGTKLDGSPKYGPPPCRHKKCDHAIDAEGCIADDREVIKIANPSVGRSFPPAISWDYIGDERRKLQGDAIEEYFKERLSVGVEDHDADGQTIFGPAHTWTDGRREFVADGVGAVGIAMSADRQWIGLTGASLIEVVEDEDPEAEPVDLILVAPILHTTDAAAAIAEAKRIQDKHDCVVVLDDGGPASTLLEDFEDEDVAVETLTLKQYAKASGDFYDGVAKSPRRIVYLANAELDTQVGVAEWKWVGDHRVIGRRDGQEAVDTTLLEAAVLAADQAALGGSFNIA
jgi:hypothetical protein